MTMTTYLVIHYYSRALGQHTKCFQVEGDHQRACKVYRNKRKHNALGTSTIGMNTLRSRPTGMVIEEVIDG